MGVPSPTMGRRRWLGSRLLAAAIAGLTTLTVPALAMAHPLGNFTINHYAGLRVEPERVLIDVVIDFAEVPAFQERLEFDTDEDGSVSDEEAAAGRITGCGALALSLRFTIDGAAAPLTLTTAGLSFPLGSSGLSTMRLVCGFTAPIAIDVGAGRRIAFADESFPDRLGWREIVAVGSGVTVSAVDGALRGESVSQRLTAYPEDLIDTPLADTALTMAATTGGPVLPPADVPDADPVVQPSPTLGSSPIAAPEASPLPAPGASPMPIVPRPTPAAAAIPGGVGGELPAVFAATDLTPAVVLLALVTAAGLGAGHALTPGHGKTLMAAYLVGTRGTPLHALALGLAVSVSHTAGILVLAAIVVGAADVLPPDVVVRAAPVVAAISILVIGAWMLIGELRRRRAIAAHDLAGAHGHAHDHDPDADTSITWRGLFALGLAGGLIPSTSALLILLGSIAAGRPALGMVLVVAFGVGMAAVMAGIGLLVVAGRERLDRVELGGGLARARATVPLAAAVLVTGFGAWLTIQAIAGGPAL